MYDLKQWMLWTTMPGTPKPRKVPVNPHTMETHNAHARDVWIDYVTAKQLAAERPGYGVAFVFTAEDPYFFIDLDHAYQDGAWSAQATELYTRFAGCFWEISTSGTGAHIIGRYDGPRPAHKCKNLPHGLELYTASRFVALTETGVAGQPTQDATQALHATIAQYFPHAANARALVAITDSADPEWQGPEDDEELIRRALRSRSAGAAFGAKASFEDLWTANPTALGQFFPDDGGEQGRPYDESSADAALAQHLAFWTGRHGSRMVRLMERSALARDKWKREDYMERTVVNACNLSTTVYQGSKETAAPPPTVEETDAAAPTHTGDIMRSEMRRANGVRFMHTTQQEDHFAGCVYVTDLDAVMLPDGTTVNNSRFRSLYGGHKFALDAQAEKTTKSAWEAFVESQAMDWPKVHTCSFRPELPPGEIWSEGGQTMVNSYRPVDVPCEAGDASRFVDHVHALVPTGRDAEILMSYMAAVVQYPGIKFQWCPLVQGCEGNGKSMLTDCVAAAVGERYTHRPQAQDLTNKLNSWLDGKILIGVEDIYVPDDRGEIMESLKPMVTARNGIEIHRKGFDQVTRRICCNFMLNSNHKDALRKHKGDRRFAIFYTAQQCPEDIHAAGMGGNHFPELYNWLRHGGGFAVVTNYLRNYAIPDEFNPATHCHRAPETSSTQEALVASMGAVEQEIMAAVEEGRQGFAGGWVSSIALDTLLKEMRRTVARNKRGEILKALGYERHPALPNGQAHGRIGIDDGRPRLFITVGHPDGRLTGGKEIEDAYISAQVGPRLAV